MKTKIPAVEKWTIGLDLGDRRHHLCVLDAAGDIVAEEAIANTQEVLTALGARYPVATFVMETGTHCSAHRPRCGHPLSSPLASLKATPAA